MVLAFNIFPLLAAQSSILDAPMRVGLVVLLAGLVCDTVAIVRFAPSRQLRVSPKLWGLRELMIATAALLGVTVLTNAVYAVIALVTHRGIETLAPVILPVELVLRLAALAGFIVFFRRRHLPVAASLGLDATAPVAALGWGVVFGLGSLPPVGAILAASETVCRRLGFEPSEQPIAELFATTDSAAMVVLLTVFAVVIAPVFEEFFFRGFAYPALKQRIGTRRALLIVSAAFAASHLHAPSFVPLFVLALGLGLAYELTGSLLSSIAMHAVFNSVMVAHLFYQRAHT